jgi:prevent-host-death family protein
MAIWQIREAESRLGEVIDEAHRNGPQIITRDGVECAVVLSFAKYRALTTRKPDFREHLLGGPKVDNFEMQRERHAGRKIRL